MNVEDKNTYYEAAKEVNRTASIHRSMQRVHVGVPQYEYLTKPIAKNSDKIKTLKRHPTKKVAKSQKLRKIEKAQTKSLVDLINAQERFQALDRKHNVKHR